MTLRRVAIVAGCPVSAVRNAKSSPSVSSVAMKAYRPRMAWIISAGVPEITGERNRHILLRDRLSST